MKKAGMVNPVSKLTAGEIKKSEKAAGNGFKFIQATTKNKLSGSGFVQYFKVTTMNGDGEIKIIDLSVFLSDRRKSYTV